MVTSAGKNTTIPLMTVVASTPRPNTKVSTGVIATSGTDRTSTASGSSIPATVRDNAIDSATATAATSPATKPNDAPSSVRPRPPSTDQRAADPHSHPHPHLGDAH